VGVTTEGDDTVIWDPQVEGLLASQADMKESSRHLGERHLDADEFVCLISGRTLISLEDSDGQVREVALRPGEACVVPLQTWHRVLIEEPRRLLSSARAEQRSELRARHACSLTRR
jgi:mannose-6-phosphate isomerase-like protein (cupin superfamily)